MHTGAGNAAVEIQVILVRTTAKIGVNISSNGYRSVRIGQMKQFRLPHCTGASSTALVHENFPMNTDDSLVTTLAVLLF